MAKKIIIELKSKERFQRYFEKEVNLKYYFARLGFGKSGTYMGRLTRNGVKLYRAKPGLLSLFALTATGVSERENGQDLLRVRFGRSLALTLFWGAWCAFMILAGILLLGMDLGLATFFLVPGIALLLPLFLFSKKEKARLLKFLEGVGVDQETKAE